MDNKDSVSRFFNEENNDKIKKKRCCMSYGIYGQILRKRNTVCGQCFQSVVLSAGEWEESINLIHYLCNDSVANYLLFILKRLMSIFLTREITIIFTLLYSFLTNSVRI